MHFYNGDKGEGRQTLNPVRAMDAGSDLNLPLPVFSIEKDRLILRLSIRFFVRKESAIMCDQESAARVDIEEGSGKQCQTV